MKTFFPALVLSTSWLALGGCMHVKTDPIEVKPIQITMDVNFKVDRALDNFFGDIDRKPAAGNAAPQAGSAAPLPPEMEKLHRQLAQRRDAINALKARGAVGEDNRGLLAVRGALSDDELRLVDAHNADRSEVYQLIAAQSQGSTTAEQVGRQRALKLSEHSKSGTWLQDADGAWARKP